jgi:hypothetical protein
MVRGETNSRAATSLFAQPFADKFHDVELGSSQRRPTAAGAFSLATPTLRAGDRFLDRECRTFGPRRIEVVLAHGISQRSDPGLIFGVEDPESHHAHTLTDCFRGAEQPRRRQVVACIGRHHGKAVESERNDEDTPEAGRQVEGVEGIAFGSVRRQRKR